VLLGEVALWLVALWSAVLLVEEVLDALLLSGGLVLPPPGGLAPEGPLVDGLAEFCCPCVLWSAEEPAVPVAPVAEVLPLPTELGEVWLLTGGVVVDVEPVVPVAAAPLLVSGGVVVVVVVLWVLVVLDWLPMLLVEPVEPAVGLVVVAEVPLAPMLPEEDWLVQESEILLTELTWNEPSLAWLPWIETCWPSYCFRLELSPLRFTVWPLSEARVQLPPDCRRQPVIEF
jgi:hypothetical protein